MQKSIPVVALVCVLGTTAFVTLQFSVLLFLGDLEAFARNTLFLLIGIAAACALALTGFVARVLKDAYFIVARKPVFPVVAGALFLLAVIMQLASSSGALGGGAHLLAAASAGAMGFIFAGILLLWGGVWGALFSALEDKRLCFYALCSAFALGLCCIGVILYVNPSKREMALLLLLLAAAAMGLLSVSYREMFELKKTWTESRLDDTPSTLLRLRPYTAAFTFTVFTVCLSCEIGFVQTAVGFVLGGTAALLSLIICSSYRKEIPSFFVEPWAFFAAELTVVFSFVLIPNIVFAALFGGAFSIYYVFYFLAIGITVSRSELSPYAHFVLRIYRPMIGLMAGLVAVFLLFLVFPGDMAVKLATLISFTVLCINHMRDPLYWQEWASLYRCANGIEDLADNAKLGAHALSVVRWEDTCRELADGFDLSDREKDVFLLLAKGRNAALIAEKLFISINTARTHIYRIYSKTGIENQQELISLVEDEQLKRKGQGGNANGAE